MVSYRNGFINNHYMKDFHELLRLRRSTRKFTEQEIASDDVKTIMEAALMAPSSKRSLSWEFVLVEAAGCRYAAVMVKTANRPKISYGNY